MAAKRLFDEPGATDPDRANGKRPKSFASVLEEAVTANYVKRFCSALEPILRKVVNEEVENGLRRCERLLTRSSSLRIEPAHESSSSLRLSFRTALSLPIFTGSKIFHSDNSHLQIQLLEKTSSDQLVPTSLPHPIKIEIVVLNGDFVSETWTTEEFNKSILKERSGKPPLLAGDIIVTMRAGLASLGDIEFTDNSSWIRSRKFRLGARVVPVQGTEVRVHEAVTESFVVKDHRGELYRKHHPPQLEDEVWRLVKIGKDGVFHRKLSSAHVNTVQDLLKMLIVEPNKLRQIFGVGMSEKMWEATIKHARTCNMGDKLYRYRGANYDVVLSPVCRVLKAEINGQTFPTQELTPLNRATLEKLVREAYGDWNSLEQIDGPLHDMPLLAQGDAVAEYPNHNYENMHVGSSTYHQQHHGFTSGGSTLALNNGHVEGNDWVANSAFFSTPICSATALPFDMSEEEASPQGDFRPSTITRSFMKIDHP
ncbi:hypothetical protein NMG60_11002340 [Bertholletia excelsa]